MSTFNKLLLSGSTNGRNILIAATVSSSATPIHTAASQGSLDEVWLWACNTGNSVSALNIQFGGTTNPGDQISSSIAPADGAVLMIPGWCVQSGSIVSAFAPTTNIIVINGYVNRITL